MKAKDVVGKTIVGVKHVRIWRDGRSTVVVECLILSNGSRLVPFAHPTDDVPAGDLDCVRSKLKNKSYDR